MDTPRTRTGGSGRRRCHEADCETWSRADKTHPRHLARTTPYARRHRRGVPFFIVTIPSRGVKQARHGDNCKSLFRPRRSSSGAPSQLRSKTMSDAYCCARRTLILLPSTRRGSGVRLVSHGRQGHPVCGSSHRRSCISAPGNSLSTTMKHQPGGDAEGIDRFVSIVLRDRAGRVRGRARQGRAGRNPLRRINGAVERRIFFACRPHARPRLRHPAACPSAPRVIASREKPPWCSLAERLLLDDGA